MSTRVTDEQVLHALAWARNYGTWWSGNASPAAARRWLVKLAQQGVTIEYAGPLDTASVREMSRFLGPRAQDVVPSELVLTNREVLLLLYGLAAGAERPGAARRLPGGVGAPGKVRARHDGARAAIPRASAELVVGD
jgi:hypothetical protein